MRAVNCEGDFKIGVAQVAFREAVALQRYAPLGTARRSGQDPLLAEVARTLAERYRPERQHGLQRQGARHARVQGSNDQCVALFPVRRHRQVAGKFKRRAAGHEFRRRLAHGDRIQIDFTRRRHACKIERRFEEGHQIGGQRRAGQAERAEALARQGFFQFQLGASLEHAGAGRLEGQRQLVIGAAIGGGDVQVLHRLRPVADLEGAGPAAGVQPDLLDAGALGETDCDLEIRIEPLRALRAEARAAEEFAQRPVRDAQLGQHPRAALTRLHTDGYAARQAFAEAAAGKVEAEAVFPACQISGGMLHCAEQGEIGRAHAQFEAVEADRFEGQGLAGFRQRREPFRQYRVGIIHPALRRGRQGARLDLRQRIAAEGPEIAASMIEPDPAVAQVEAQDLDASEQQRRGRQHDLGIGRLCGGTSVIVQQADILRGDLDAFRFRRPFELQSADRDHAPLACIGQRVLDIIAERVEIERPARQAQEEQRAGRHQHQDQGAEYLHDNDGRGLADQSLAPQKYRCCRRSIGT